MAWRGNARLMELRKTSNLPTDPIYLVFHEWVDIVKDLETQAIVFNEAGGLLNRLEQVMM